MPIQLILSMTKVTLTINRSIEKNTAIYYEKAKKAKKKLKGTKKALEISQKKLEELKKKKLKEIEKIKQQAKKKPKPAKQKWYEKFRWFYSSEGFLCIGGRDATTNEIIIKKHTEKNDLVFHTKIEGSPFFVIKTEGKKPSKATLEETAQATVSYSRAWKLGIQGLETFYVKPEQLSKQAPSGEYVEKGAFIVKGKMNFVHANLKLAIGIKNRKVIGGPVNAIKKNAEKYVVIIQGKQKTSSAAKQTQKKIGGSLDEIIRFVPAGGVQVKN